MLDAKLTTRNLTRSRAWAKGAGYGSRLRLDLLTMSGLDAARIRHPHYRGTLLFQRGGTRRFNVLTD